jgi:hypothetical protein
LFINRIAPLAPRVRLQRGEGSPVDADHAFMVKKKPADVSAGQGATSFGGALFAGSRQQAGLALQPIERLGNNLIVLWPIQ